MAIVGSELAGLGSVATAVGAPAPAAGGITQLTGPVTAGPGSGAQATTVTANAITNPMLAQMAPRTWKMRKTNSAGDPEDATLAEVRGLITLAAADLTALAAVVVAGLTSGQEAFVVSNTLSYFLQTTAQAADGAYVIATADDPARKWIAREAPIVGRSIAFGYFFTETIDLKVTGDYQIIPPLPYRYVLTDVPTWDIISISASTVSPTYSIGTNSPNYDNLYTSQTSAQFTTGVVDQNFNPASLTLPRKGVDMTTSGLRVRVSAGATATALTARLLFSATLVPV